MRAGVVRGLGAELGMPRLREDVVATRATARVAPAAWCTAGQRDAVHVGEANRGSELGREENVRESGSVVILGDEGKNLK